MPNAKTSNLDAKHRIFLIGDTGSGKTTQILTLPRPTFCYCFDSNAVLSLAGHDIDYEEFLPDRLNIGVKSLGKSAQVGVKPKQTYQNNLYTAFEADFNNRVDRGDFDKYNSICIDSATTLLDLIMDHVLTINGRPGSWPQQDDYGPQMVAFTNVVRSLTSMNKTLLMTGHLEMRQDELSKRIYRTPLMTGRLKTKIPLLFSDIFITDTEVDAKGQKVYRLQTVPDRITTTVRTAIKGLSSYENVTLDFSKPLDTQGIGKLISKTA